MTYKYIRVHPRPLPPLISALPSSQAESISDNTFQHLARMCVDQGYRTTLSTHGTQESLLSFFPGSTVMICYSLLSHEIFLFKPQSLKEKCGSYLPRSHFRDEESKRNDLRTTKMSKGLLRTRTQPTD